MARGAHGCSRLWVSDAGAHKLRHAPGCRRTQTQARAWIRRAVSAGRACLEPGSVCGIDTCAPAWRWRMRPCVVLRSRTLRVPCVPGSARVPDPASALRVSCCASGLDSCSQHMPSPRPGCRGRRHAAHGSLVCHCDREPTQLVAGGHDRHWSHRHLTAPRCGRRDLEDGDAECLSEGAVEVYVALPRADIRPGRHRQLLEGAGRC